MTVIAVGKYVKVVKGNDETFDSQYLGMEGLVFEHNTNGMTGNTPDDPLHRVKFDLNTVPVGHPNYDEKAVSIQDFWFDELEVVNKN